MPFSNFRNWRPDRTWVLSGLAFAPERRTLGDLPVGYRLMCRSRTDWRTAVVSRITEEKSILTVCSPTGRTYRLSRTADSEIVIDGEFSVLKYDEEENWRENFADYDVRW
jgi:hypothetical protein